MKLPGKDIFADFKLMAQDFPYSRTAIRPQMPLVRFNVAQHGIFTKPPFSPNLVYMFVSIAVDPGSEGRAKELADLLAHYGFERIQRGLWESAFISPETLSRVKRDLDKATDAFDRVRLFQFPVDGTLVLTSLKDKKWRRMVARNTEKPGPPVRAAARIRKPAHNKPTTSH
jgi:CRISPR-associated protein Cas2